MTSPQPISIRIIPFERKYEEDVIRLILPIQRVEFGIDISEADQPDLRAIPASYQQGNGNFWLALAAEAEAEQLAGTVALIDLGAQQVALRKMFVGRAYRGSEFGVSHALLHGLLDWARERHIHEIFLGTTPVMHADHRFYEKNGFVEIAVSQLPANFPIMPVDKKFYQYTVHQKDIT